MRYRKPNSVRCLRRSSSHFVFFFLLEPRADEDARAEAGRRFANLGMSGVLTRVDEDGPCITSP
jgi:hypothetical protein